MMMFGEFNIGYLQWKMCNVVVKEIPEIGRVGGENKSQIQVEPSQDLLAY